MLRLNVSLAFIFSPVLLIAAGLSACHAPGTASMNSETTQKTIVIKENPNPRQSYRIVMTIENAPGPFGIIEGSAQYDVTNHNECGEINRSAGTISRINTHPPIAWEKRSDTEYVATVHADLMMDDDYYGRGLCRWAFTEVRGRLKATGAESETRFVPAISYEQVAAGQTVTWHFWKGSYPADNPLPSNGKGFPDFGYQSPEKFKPELRNELFTITITPTEFQP